MDRKAFVETVASLGINLTEEQVERVFADIASKRRMSRYLHAAPATLSEPAD